MSLSGEMTIDLLWWMYCWPIHKLLYMNFIIVLMHINYWLLWVLVYFSQIASWAANAFVIQWNRIVAAIWIIGNFRGFCWVAFKKKKLFKYWIIQMTPIWQRFRFHRVVEWSIHQQTTKSGYHWCWNQRISMPMWKTKAGPQRQKKTISCCSKGWTNMRNDQSVKPKHTDWDRQGCRDWLLVAG